MDPPYQYMLPSGTHLFRAKTIAKEGRWYTLNLDDSYIYGREITEYSTTKDLKLLNIMSLTFHNDFIDRLNTFYPGVNNKGFDVNKLLCLIPLGLIDLNSQVNFSNVFNLNPPIYDASWNNIHELTNIPLMNRHRFSEHYLDTHLVSVLEQIYGNYYDGYISPLKWPTKLHGDHFHQEVCLFKLGNVKEENNHIRPYNGGSSQKIKHLNIQKSPFDVDHQEIYDKLNTLYINNSSNPKIFWNPHTQDTTISQNSSQRVKNKTRRRNRMTT